MDIYNKLDEIGKHIEESKTLPLFNQKMVDGEFLMNTLEEVYASIPVEFTLAKEIIKNQENTYETNRLKSEELLNKTKHECETLVTKAEEQAKSILDDNNLRDEAEKEAKKLFGDCASQAREIERETNQKCEELRRDALEKAKMIEEQAIQRANRIKAEADQYAEQILNHIEKNVLSQLETIQVNGKKHFAELKEQNFFVSN